MFLDEKTTTLDFFEGAWEGTIILEIENSDKEPPLPVLAEVTGNPKYYTSNMA